MRVDPRRFVLLPAQSCYKKGAPQKCTGHSQQAAASAHPQAGSAALPLLSIKRKRTISRTRLEKATPGPIDTR
jgi:hypothetical protein